MNRKNMLVETVRERRGKIFSAVEGVDGGFHLIPKRVPVGVFVGVNDHGCIRIGWSRCRQAPAHIADEILARFRPEEKQAYLHDVRNSDKFNFERGITEALRNILMPIAPPVHRGFARRFGKFKTRCERYFKNAAFIETNGQMSMRPTDSTGEAYDLVTFLKEAVKMIGADESSISLMVPGRMLPKNIVTAIKGQATGIHGVGCRCKPESKTVKVPKASPKASSKTA